MTDELFKTAPREVLDYFDRRPSVPTYAWNDIAPREHALAWTAAKTSGFNVIDDIRAAAREAVNYKSFEAFRADLEPILRAKGWWGRKIARDPLTGKDQIVQLGSPHRLRTIYWGNVASAQAAGEWERTWQTRDVLPYLEYLISLSERKRPEHQVLVGIVLPVEDGFWLVYYPPNGWFCKCRTRQVSRLEAERAPAEKRLPPQIEMREWKNKRTGQIEKVPVGVDPGWNHNPGLLRDRSLSRGLNRALDQMPEPARRTAVQELARHPLTDYVTSGKAGRDNHVPVAVLPESLSQKIGARTTIVRASGEIGIKATRVGKAGRPHHPESVFQSYAHVQDAIDLGRVVQEGDYKLIVDRQDDDGLWWRASLTATHDGSEVFLSTWYKVGRKRYETLLRRKWHGSSERLVEIIREED